MMAPGYGRASEARGLFARLSMAAGFLGLLLASYMTAWTGSGSYLIGAMVGVLGVVLVLKRPTVGVFILMTTFLFTYPPALRGVGNLTINNILGLLLVPMMFYEMLRENSWWVFRFKPFILLTVIFATLVTSASFYSSAGTEIVGERAEAKIERSTRAQGPALFATRDEGAKLLTRLVFLVLFVFFVRTARDLQTVVLILVAALLFTYFSIGTGEGVAGWGTGRLRSLGEAGGALYAGRNPNKLAYFALLVLTLLWYGRRIIRSPILYPLWAAVTALTFAMIPLTGSRSGMLNLLVFILVVMLEGRFNMRKVLAVTAVSFVIVVQFAYETSVIDLFLPQETAQRLGNVGVSSAVLTDQSLAAQGSAGGRFRTAQSALGVWISYPLFGVGIGNFENERAVTDPFGTIGPPHNSYLWALAEGGLFAFALYIWLFAWTLRRIQEIRWEYEARYGPMQLGWLISAMRTAMIGFLFYSFFADMWYHDFFYILMGIALTLIRLHERYAETGRVPERFDITGGPADTGLFPTAPPPVVRHPVVVSLPKFSGS
jgi:O-antigen ligase